MVQLEEFTLWSESGSENIWPLKYRYETIKKFTLNPYDSAVFQLGFPFEFENLQELTLNEISDVKVIMTKIKWLKKPYNDSLQCDVKEYNDFNYDDMQRIIQQLPGLVELEFCARKFTQHQLIGWKKVATTTFVVLWSSKLVGHWHENYWMWMVCTNETFRNYCYLFSICSICPSSSIQSHSEIKFISMFRSSNLLWKIIFCQH